MLYKGSYMSVHVLLNLLNTLGKNDKMRGLPSILSLFRNEFNNYGLLLYKSVGFYYTKRAHEDVI